jgi:hypothetical protein
MPSRRTLTVVALAALLLLAGCNGAANSGGADVARSGGGDGGAATQAAADASVEKEAGTTGGGDATTNLNAVQDRALIKTGTVTVEVADFERSRSNLTSAVEGYGGFVSDTEQEVRTVDNESYVVGQVVLRVPAEQFDALLADARAQGEVQSVQTNTRDVTDQLVDIEARLENLRAERDRLRELYQDANDTEAVLQVQRELSDVQQEIERLEAKKTSLERQVAYSTLTVRLQEPRPTPEFTPPEQWYDTPVLSAFLQSVDGVVVVARALVVGVAYALPYVLAFGTPIALFGAAVWRFRGRLSSG